MLPDVAVVGGGLIGGSAARALAGAGLRVRLIDPNRPCREASYAAAGMLALPLEPGLAGPFFELCRRSRSLFPDFASLLHEETGLDAELARSGTIVPVQDDDDEAWAGSLADAGRGAGVRVDRMDRADLRRHEPWLSEAHRFALHFPDDLSVDNRRLCEAMVAALEAREIPCVIGRPVVGLERSSAAVTAVRLADGEKVPAGAVVLCAGAWSGLVDGLPRPLPVEPRRGQMLALGAPPGAFRHTIFSASAYLVPRADGRVFVGATVERVGFDKRVTAQAIARLIAGARRVAPGLGSAGLVEAWAGLRPGTPDDLPILGPDPEVPNLIYATGHFRNGILLAPVTAEIVLEILLAKRPGVALEAFRPDRFGEPAEGEPTAS